VRGISVSQRSNRYGTVEGYFQSVNDHISVVVQIESRAGVAEASAIAAVDGVDGLFIGPSDLAAGYGHLGRPDHPDVRAAMGQVFAAARQAGKPVGILAPAEVDARRYMAQGATLVAVGSDLGALRNATQALADKYLQSNGAPT
jgi:2-dehydro-3-deoxyglucarate aldolase